jgi:hypothetical protein
MLIQIDNQLSLTETRKFIIYVILTALVLRVLALLFPFHLWGDWQTYNELAWTWAQTGAYSVGGVPYAYRPPGFPFLLSRLYLIFGHYPHLGAIANIVFSCGIVFLTYLLIREIWNERIARWSAIILVFFPSQILFVNKLATEPMFTALFLAALLVLVLSNAGSRGRLYYPLIGGVVLGLATLTRAITLIYLIFPAVYWYMQTGKIGKAVRNTILALIGFVLIVVPWMVRNYQLKGSFTIATNSGINFLIGNAPGSGMGWNQEITEEFDVSDPEKQVYVDSTAWKRGWKYIKDDPPAFLKRGILKVAYFYATDMEGVWNELTDAANNDRLDRYVLVGLLAESYYMLILFAAVMGVFFIYRRNPVFRKPGGFILWITIAYWTAVHFVFFGDGRFHFSIIPMISSFAALYIASACGHEKNKPGS